MSVLLIKNYLRGHQLADLGTMEQELNLPAPVIEHALSMLTRKGLVQVIEPTGGGCAQGCGTGCNTGAKKLYCWCARK